MRLIRVQFVLAAIIVCSLPVARPAAAALNCGPFVPTQFGPIQTCDAGIPSGALDVTARIEPNVQLQSQWCWAASISGVFAYYGHPVSQARIVREAYGSVVNMRGSPQAIMGSLNRPWVDDAGRPFRVTSDVFSSNWVTAAQDLAQGMPLIVGSLGWHHKQIIRKFQPWLERGEAFLLEDVLATELRVLYSHARATVCPSFGEGFDFSGVEAMKCGSPVVASDIPVHREVYADAAEFFNPYSVDSLSQAIHSVIDPAHSGRREDLITKGAIVAERYVHDSILPKWQSFLQLQTSGVSTSATLRPSVAWT